MPASDQARLFRVPYGRGEIEFALPASVEATLLESKVLPALPDVRASIREALAHPVAGPRLRDLARPGARVAIVVTDVTRACPDHLLVPPLLDELAAGGVALQDITVVVGIGLHRPSTPEEWVEKLGPDVAGRVRIVNPRPTDPSDLVDLGTTPEGVPALVNRAVAEADLVVATGIVEPHQYAGYSGGRKTVAIGAGGEPTIQVSHGPAMLEHPRVRLGQLDGNPFHTAVSEIARRAELRFVLNVVAREDKEVVAVAAGEPTEVLETLVGVARAMFTVPIDSPADLAIAGVGYPKDANLYQASRAASYLYFAPRPVVREGGVVIVPARAQEGVGEGLGEQRFHELMKAAPSARAVVEEARSRGYKAGGQRAFVMAKVLEHCEVVVVGSECPDLVRDLKMTPAATMAEALALAFSRVGTSARAYVIPHALLTLPVIRLSTD
jgi:lactate racemase